MRTKDTILLEQAYQLVLEYDPTPKDMEQFDKRKQGWLHPKSTLDELRSPFFQPRIDKNVGDGTENNPYRPNDETAVPGPRWTDENKYHRWLEPLFNKLEKVSKEEERPIYFVWDTKDYGSESLKFIVDPENFSGRRKSLEQQLKEMGNPKAAFGRKAPPPKPKVPGGDPYEGNPDYFQEPYYGITGKG